MFDDGLDDLFAHFRQRFLAHCERPSFVALHRMFLVQFSLVRIPLPTGLFQHVEHLFGRRLPRTVCCCDADLTGAEKQPKSNQRMVRTRTLRRLRILPSPTMHSHSRQPAGHCTTTPHLPGCIQQLRNCSSEQVFDLRYVELFCLLNLRHDFIHRRLCRKCCASERPVKSRVLSFYLIGQPVAYILLCCVFGTASV